MAYRPPYTASSAYAEARMRDAEHDGMQLRVLQWLSSQRHDSCEFNVGPDYEPRLLRYHLGSKEPEFVFTIDRNIIGFADVHAAWHIDDDRAFAERPSGDPTDIFLFYEIKPDIGSVGGLIRQLQFTEHNAHRQYEHWHTQPLIGVVAVVRNSDPLLETLRYMWKGGILVWDRTAFSEVRAAQLKRPQWPWPRRGPL